MPANTGKECHFCARVNRDEAIVCINCGHTLQDEKDQQETNTKKSRLRFILSRVAAADFMGLNLH